MFNEILKNSIIITLFKALGAGSFFLFIVLVSNNFSPTFFGAFNLIVLTLTIASIFSKVGLDFYLVRKIPEYKADKSRLALFLKKAFFNLSCVSIVAGLVFWVLASPLDKNLFGDFPAEKYLKILPLILIIYSIYLVYVEIFRGYGMVVWYTFYRHAFLQICCLTVASVLLFAADLKFDPVFVYYAGIVAVSFCSLLHLFRFFALSGYGRLDLAGTYSEPIIKYSLPMTVISSMMFFMGYINSFMISYFMELKDVGIYSAVVKLSGLMTFITSSVATYIASGIAEAHIKDTGQVKFIFWQTFKVVSLLCLPLCAIIILFPEVLLQMFGEEYPGAYKVLYVYGLASLMNSFPFGYFLVMTDNQRSFQKIVIWACVTNIILNLVLIPRAGLMGAAAATLVSNALWNGSSFVLLRRLRLA